MVGLAVHPTNRRNASENANLALQLKGLGVVLALSEGQEIERANRRSMSRKGPCDSRYSWIVVVNFTLFLQSGRKSSIRLQDVCISRSIFTNVASALRLF